MQDGAVAANGQDDICLLQALFFCNTMGVSYLPEKELSLIHISEPTRRV